MRRRQCICDSADCCRRPQNLRSNGRRFRFEGSLFQSRRGLCSLPAVVSGGRARNASTRVRTDCSSTIADIGAGTGILSQLFLSNGNTVYAVEPNEPMRRAAIEWLGSDPKFHAGAGSAEETRLDTASADFVIAAQAFHWFDRQRCKREFARILRPGGWIVLLWNDRDETSMPFARDYEQLLVTFGKDYLQVKHRNIS